MTCDCHCNGKCGLLGGLEQKVINVLWQNAKPLKPREVLDALNRQYAYTTIMTILNRLYRKGLILRQLRGRVFYYSPRENRQEFACRCLEDLFSRLFSSYGDYVVTSFRRSLKKFRSS